METRKISVVGVISEGISIGIKNLASLVVACLLWLVTCWIPYLNVGTTIALQTIPIALSKGEVISPGFIFDAKYRRYMGEFFTLKGLMAMSLIPAYLFLIVPGIIISLGWSLSLFILLDKEVSPGEAMIRSNKATTGYKGVIFAVELLLALACYIVYLAVMFPTIFLGKIAIILMPLLVLALIIFYMVARLGCRAVIYRNLTAE